MRSFICSIVPSNKINELNIPQAAFNFCRTLIDNNCFDEIHSILPISYFDSKIKNEGKITYYSGSKHKLRILSYLKFFYNNFLCIYKNIKNDTIWFYNICNANILSFIFLRLIFRKSVYVIMLDYTQNNNIFSLSHYIPILYSLSSGVISVSERTKITNNNIKYKAGVINHIKSENKTLSKKPSKLTFLFSGTLDKHTGFPLLLEVFKELKDVELFISGIGDFDINEIKNNTNIHYLGYLDYDEYLKIYDKVNICLSLRNPSYKENLNNFPSKILEYFNYGKIVISTIEYPELDGFQYVKCKYDKDELKNTIREIQEWDIELLNLYMNNRNNLINKFSVSSWKNTFSEIEAS